MAPSARSREDKFGASGKSVEAAAIAVASEEKHERDEVIEVQSPLVVDLDGTLTPTDTLVESLLRAFHRSPGKVLAVLPSIIFGRAHFKQRVSELGTIDVGTLPWRHDLIGYLRLERSKGRRVFLATAAHRSIADQVATHLQLFDGVIATESENLKGKAKLRAIQETVGRRFSYAGDSAADLSIWRHATSAILVGSAEKFAEAIGSPIERNFPAQTSYVRAWLKALRPHQWVKNFLVFVPVLTAFAFKDARLMASGIAFAAFCLAASATYVLNDIWDLEADRAHARKRERPFAKGDLPLAHGALGSALLFLLALAVSSLVSASFALMLMGYVILTILYSWAIKQYVILDVLTLALLYTWRVLAGATAIGVAISTWLLAFSAFIFFSLALIKRCSELVHLLPLQQGSVRGRNYTSSDLAVLWPLGVSAGLSAVVVLGLYIGSVEASGAYGSPQALWLVAIILAYWISRLWIKTARGEMHDDPIVFALRDTGSRRLVVAMCLIGLAAHFIELP